MLLLTQFDIVRHHKSLGRTEQASPHISDLDSPSSSQLLRRPPSSNYSNCPVMPTLLYPNALKNTQIRLISFPQSIAETVEELQLSIHEYSLDSLPVYHALSYTWGPPRLDDPAYIEADRLSITINGLNVKVYPNLFNAL